MEVDFILCCLFMLGLTVCVGLHPLPVNCTGCICKSSNGATLSLPDVFDDPVRVTYNKVSYCFPSCLQNNPCGNDTSGLVLVSKDSVQTCRNNDIVYIQTDVNFTQQLVVNDDHCRIVISCSPPPTQLDGEVVFNVSDRSCGKLKSFVSSANMNVVLTSTSVASSSATPTSFIGSSTLSTSEILIITSSSASPSSSTMMSSLSPNMSSSSTVMSSSLSPNMSLSSTVMSSSSSMMSSSPTTPSSSNVVPPSHPPTINNSGGNKLLYIVIPTAAPVAFIVSFATVFCLLNWCHQRNKKKLYIKLTSTIYSEEDDSDNSDD